MQKFYIHFQNENSTQLATISHSDLQIASLHKFSHIKPNYRTNVYERNVNTNLSNISILHNLSIKKPHFITLPY